MVAGAILFPSNSSSSPSGNKAVEFVPLISIESFLCGMPVTPTVPYLFTGLAGCSVDRVISRGTRKLARTPTLIKKKKNAWTPMATTKKKKKEAKAIIIVNLKY